MREFTLSQSQLRDRDSGAEQLEKVDCRRNIVIQTASKADVKYAQADASVDGTTRKEEFISLHG
jgi:hypothetical protein